MEISLIAWPEEVRDIAIIVYVSVGAVAFVLMAIFTLIVGSILTSTVLKVRGIVKDNVQPAAQNVQAATSTVRTTVTFVSEYAINPVAKAYGSYHGARRFISVLARFRGKGG
jgi:hypothetical protein